MLSINHILYNGSSPDPQKYPRKSMLSLRTAYQSFEAASVSFCLVWSAQLFVWCHTWYSVGELLIMCVLLKRGEDRLYDRTKQNALTSGTIILSGTRLYCSPARGGDGDSPRIHLPEAASAWIQLWCHRLNRLAGATVNTIRTGMWQGIAHPPVSVISLWYTSILMRPFHFIMSLCYSCVQVNV